MKEFFSSPKIKIFLSVLLVLITLICAEIAKRGRVLLFEEHEEIKKTERISMELDLAKSIQKNMIPNLYPAFPDRKEFDVYARMEPAKELGGDFYDYYMIDRDHLAIIIADVSGKGIPAAMFMMASKIMINNRAKSRSHDPAKILKAVNKQIQKATKGSSALSYTVAPYYVSASSDLIVKYKKNSSRIKRIYIRFGNNSFST